MKAILKEQMFQNVFAYVNDIVVASKKKAMQIDDLAETFANMCGAQLNLNLEKCVFEVQKGKVLGCLVLVKGIEAYRFFTVLRGSDSFQWGPQKQAAFDEIKDHIQYLPMLIQS
jgi:hypothetical protein